jgi:hypothetical protein
VLNGYDAVVIQHEFGISEARTARTFQLLARLEVPVMVAAHRPPESFAEPAHDHRCLAAAADRVVAQSEVARTRLLAGHGVDPDRVVVIQHGAHANLAPRSIPQPTARPVILTWGLIGPARGSSTRSTPSLLRDLDYARVRDHGRDAPEIVEQSGGPIASRSSRARKPPAPPISSASWTGTTTPTPSSPRSGAPTSS